jgi:oligopeptide/dipeptide ABC transporter ATP-binding protein
VVEHISDRVVIMYLGRVVEAGPTPELYAAPNHPYTQALLAEAGKVEPKKRTFVPIQGEIPSPLAPPPGCHFHPRCPYAMPICRASAPELRQIAPARWRLPLNRRSDERMSRRAANGEYRSRSAKVLSDRALSSFTLRPRRRSRSSSILRIPASTILTTSIMRRRVRSCGAPRIRTSRRSVSWRPRFGATLIEANFPRAYIDANAVSPTSIRASRRSVARRRSCHRARPSRASGSSGVSRAAATPMYERKLTVEEVERRIDRWYRPYHAALTAEMDARHRAFGAAWHINCHSMPAVGDANADDPGRERADFVLGDRDGTTCEPAVHRIWWQDPAQHALQRGRQRSVQRCASSCGARPPERATAQPADRAQSAPLHGGDDVEPNANYANLERDLERLVAAVSSYIRAKIGQTT